MSSTGFPDWQRITQWFGSPVDQADGLVIGAGAHNSGPFDLLSYASVIVCVRATVAPITVTVTQSIPGGPAALSVSSSFVVPVGVTIFEAFVLEAGGVQVAFQGGGAGCTVDYAIVPSNNNLNAEVSSLAVLAFQHNDVAVANESAIDLEDSAQVLWTLTDDPGNSRVKVAAQPLVDFQHAGVHAAYEPALDFEDSATIAYTLVDAPPNSRMQVSAAIVNSVALPGSPTTTTPATADNSTKLATTAYVKAQGYVTAATSPVTSVFGRGGAVGAGTGDYTAAMVTNAADKASAATQSFTGSVSTSGALVASGAVTAGQRFIAGANAIATAATPIVPDWSSGELQQITFTGGSATPVLANSPVAPGGAQTGRMAVEVFNNSGHGITLGYGTTYKLAGFAAMNPGTGFRQMQVFQWSGTAWVCNFTSGSY